MRPKTLRRIVIDPRVIHDNWTLILDHLGPGTRPVWVVKSNLYGLGLECLRHVSADIAGYGVEDCRAARAVNRLDDTKPVFLLYPIPPVYFPPEIFPLVWSGRVVPAVGGRQQIDEWTELARHKGVKKFGVQVKMRSFGGRFGVEPEDIVATIEHALRKGLELKGIFSHPSRSVVSSLEELQQECDRFVAKVRRAAPGTPVHFADSACVMRGVGNDLDRVRIGMLPLGLLPLRPEGRWTELKLPFTVYARVIHIHALAEAETIGYAQAGPKQVSHAAVAAMGYAHGLPRNIEKTGYGWWHGKKVQYASKPWMEFSPFAIEEEDGDILGSEIEILGPNTSPNLFAWAAGKAPEEFVSTLSPSIKREMVG
ncbi:MAG: hypothetical protein AMJ94_16170 [Deltaproteobacteria bacterium SM23_61]|nr:MAG: hypothetical protein AMJ94_16170 [Deltaproteobacteria bacterium SM23_61]